MLTLLKSETTWFGPDQADRVGSSGGRHALGVGNAIR